MNHPVSAHRLSHMIVAATLAFATPWALADSAFEAERQLIADVTADGMLYGFARICSVPQADLEKFATKIMADAKRVVQAQNLPYPPAKFERDFSRGVANASGMAEGQPPGSEARERNCVEIRAKVQRLLESK